MSENKSQNSLEKSERSLKTNSKESSTICAKLRSAHIFGFPHSKADPAVSSAETQRKTCQPIEALKRVYREAVLPLEKAFKYPDFYSPSLTDTDFDAKPIVLCVGQYSTGKTSFVRYLIERDFPGLRIGPEPTTDRFVAVMRGEHEKIIPGNAAAALPDKPFRALKSFGMSFLNKFECAELNSPILRKLTLVDTPGVLAGSEQTRGRAYDFPRVVRWFAERADRILLFFDANKLDISDEMKATIGALEGHDEKMRCILNKADAVTGQQLMRVYGALMWSLGKVVKTPEVPRIFIGSFWEQPYAQKSCEELFEAEESDLFAELRALPRNSVVRKINELVKRAKKVRIHCIVLTHLREKIGFFNKQKRQKKLLRDIAAEFAVIKRKHSIPAGDLPDAERYRSVLANLELSSIKRFHRKAMEALEKALSKDIPAILDEFVKDDIASGEAANDADGQSPFADEKEGKYVDGEIDSFPPLNTVQRGAASSIFKQSAWVISGSLKSKFDNLYDRMSVGGRKIPGKAAKELMFKSKLSLPALRKIWNWSDIDKDFSLDRDEFALCMHLVELFKRGEGERFGEELPLEFIPPSKRHL